MSDDPLRRYLDDFGRRLEEAATFSSRRPSWRLALAGAVTASAAAAIVLLLVVVSGGDGRLDVVAKARAALADRGRLVHLIARERVRVSPSVGRVVGPRRFSFRWEQWATGNPPRWRIAYSYGGGYQLAFGHRTWSLYEQRRNRLTIERRLRPKFATTIPSSTSVLFGKAANGPIATIRAMLRRGELRDDGFASVGGRTVRRLVGKRPVFPGRSRPHIAVRYFVDPDTYTPVAARIGRPLRARAGGSQSHSLGGYSRISFTSFERLPLTAHNARLLDIRPVGHPRVTHFRANRAAGVVPCLRRQPRAAEARRLESWRVRLLGATSGRPNLTFGGSPAPLPVVAAIDSGACRSQSTGACLGAGDVELSPKALEVEARRLEAMACCRR